MSSPDMASADVLLAQGDNLLGSVDVVPSKRKGSDSITPASVLDLAGATPERLTFEPAKHLQFVPPKKVWTMEEIGLGNVGISPNAVSQPFPLFTEAAIKQMRGEILSKPVFEKCQYSSNLAACQLRGFASVYAPFVYDVWRSPEVLAIVSKIAGVELVPQMDFEIAHVNISINSAEQVKEAEKAITEHSERQRDEGVAGCPWEDDQPIVDWHSDSYPFVCVTMLSDCTNMIGGETALRTGDGSIMKVRGPGMGNAVILQGRYIEHQALRALGCSERITTVTSFRPKSAFIKDDTVLTTVRSISDLSELYSQYTEYRLEMLEQRVSAHLQEIRERKRGGKQFDTQNTKSFIREQRDFLESMLREMVDDEQVVKGHTDDSHLFSADLKDRGRKKMKMLSM